MSKAKSEEKESTMTEFLQSMHKSAKSANAGTGLASFVNCKAWDGCSFYIVYGAKDATKAEILEQLAQSLYSGDDQ